MTDAGLRVLLFADGTPPSLIVEALEAKGCTVSIGAETVSDLAPYDVVLVAVEADRFTPASLAATRASLGGDRTERHAVDMALVDEIESVRTRNNVNWMDLLRIGLTHAPRETKAVLGRINADDGRISELLRKLSE